MARKPREKHMHLLNEQYGLGLLKMNQSVSIPVDDRRRAVLVQQQVSAYWRFHGRPDSRLKTRHQGGAVVVTRTAVLSLADSDDWKCGEVRWVQCPDRLALRSQREKLNQVAVLRNRPYRFRLRTYSDGGAFQKEIKNYRQKRHLTEAGRYREVVSELREMAVGEERIFKAVTPEFMRRIQDNVRATMRISLRLCGIGNYRVTRVG
jgi:hypothetical protein